MLPDGGYSKLIEGIYNMHKGEVRFNQHVVKIDYNEETVRIYTKDSVYLAKKVISSLPLGILQRALV